MAPRSYKDYTGDGSTTTFSITFDYQKESEISVTVDGVAQSGFTFPSSTQVQLTTAPIDQSLVRVRRTTDLDTREVDFASGSVLTEEDLDNSNIQVFHAAQEAIDTSNDAISLDDDDKWDANSKVIKNVANPVNAQDAATKDYLENTWLTTADKTQLNALDTDNLDLVADDVANVNTVAGSIANVNTVAGNDTNITTVAGISSNVTTVAGISANVTTVAGDSADIQAVAGKTAELGLLGTADAVADMNTLGTAAIVADLDTLANISTDIEAVADIVSDVTTVADNDANVTTVAGNNANITTVAGVSSDVTTVAGISANVTTVANDGTDIGTVAGISSNVTTVAGISSDVTTVAGISADVTTAATNAADITAVADEVSKVIAVANDLAEATSEIDVVAGSIANVDLVGGSIANVNTVATNIADVNSFADTYFISATAPSSPTEGDLWFDTANDLMKVYDGNGFVNAGSSVNGTANRVSYVVGTSEGSYDGSTTVFPITYDSGYIDVYLNGVKLTEDDFTATNGTSITLDVAASTGDTLDAIGYGTFELLNLDISNDTSPQLGGNLDVNGNEITSASNGDVTINPNGTGDIILDASVGIGTTSPTSYDSRGNNLVVGDSGDAGITIFSGATSDARLVFTASGDTGLSNGQIHYDNNDDKLRVATGGSDRFAIDSSGNVGIGTTSPAGILDIRNGTNQSVIIGNSGSYAGGEYGQLLFKESNTELSKVQWNGTGNEFEITNKISGPLVLKTNNTERVRILSSGGVTFNGDTAAANALDDYEEGDWTPTLFGATTAGVAVYGSANRGRYVKVGNSITVSFRVQVSSFSTAPSGTLCIGGLPYDNGSDAQEWTGSFMADGVDFASASYVTSCLYLANNAGFMRIYHTRDNDGWTADAINNEAQSIIGTITYRTD